MTVSEVTVKLMQIYVSANIYMALMEKYGARSLRERLLYKALKGLVKDIEYYVPKRTPLRCMLFILRSFPKMLLIRLLAIGWC